MSKAWAEAKERRAEIIGGRYCEICGKSSCSCNIIGHHIINRKYKHLEYEVPELCELRCTEDERICHEIYQDGNRPEDKQRIKEYFERHESREKRD